MPSAGQDRTRASCLEFLLETAAGRGGTICVALGGHLSFLGLVFFTCTLEGLVGMCKSCTEWGVLRRVSRLLCPHTRPTAGKHCLIGDHLLHTL